MLQEMGRICLWLVGDLCRCTIIVHVHPLLEHTHSNACLCTWKCLLNHLFDLKGSLAVLFQVVVCPSLGGIK